MAISKKKFVFIALALVVLAVTATALLMPRRFDGTVNALQLDLSRPDALIRTRSLSRLPADLLRVPLARDVLTEAFVDYYESHEQRLALSGTVRRLAFEHSLSLPERVLESVFDEPAEVALWRGGDGSLKYFAVAMTRNAVAKALQLALPVVPKGDAQLSSAGTLHGTDVPVLVLEYGYRHRLLLLARGDRVVVLSDPGMLLGEAQDQASGQANEPAESGRKAAAPPQDGQAAKFLARLLDAGAQQASPFAGHFTLTAAGADEVHQLVIGAATLSFGYNAFAPGFDALAFSFDDKGNWRTAALLDGAALPAGGLDGAALWPAIPHGASLCALLPVAWPSLAPLAESLQGAGADKAAAGNVSDLLAGPAAVCWYGESRLYTPLFVAGLKAPAGEAEDAQLAALFSAAVGKAPEKAAPLETSRRDDGSRLWRRQVKTPFGGGKDGERGLAPSMAVSGRVVMFSPDPALVDKGLDVAGKLYPALSDSLPDGARTVVVVDPAPLAALMRKETFSALPRGEETVLRNAADAHLLPRLEVLAKYPAFRLVRGGDAPGQARAWQALTWESAAARDTASAAR